MSVDAATFALEYVEFANVNTSHPAMVARALRLAATEVDADVFLEAYQDAVFLKAAHALALSPFGENLRAGYDKNDSPYLAQYILLRNARVDRVLVGGGYGSGY
jgi:hypothetical protein